MCRAKSASQKRLCRPSRLVAWALSMCLRIITEISLHVKFHNQSHSLWHKATLFSSPEPKARVSYCHSAPSVVRPSVCLSVRRSASVVRRFRHLLQNRLMDFDEIWWEWYTHGPLQVLLFFGQIRPGADLGRGKNRSRGSLSSRNFFFKPDGYSDKPNR